MLNWLEPEPMQVPSALLELVEGHDLLAQALLRRGLATVTEARAFLDPGFYAATRPDALPDLAIARDRLDEALGSQQRVLVWGDFDVDGITSTTLLVEAFRARGGEVLWHVPDRHRESHGLHWSTLQPFVSRGVRLLVTCDTGVTAHEEVMLARNAGLDVIITDHHELPAQLPRALAVVNPKRLAPGHPARELSGAGVALMLSQSLGLDQGLDLAALGLIADVVPLRGDVRYLVQRGLRELRRCRRLGLNELIAAAGVARESLSEEDVSFSLAPRLNALGRLANASAGVELLLTRDLVRSRAIVAEIEALNVRRQFLSRQVTEAAIVQLSQQPELMEAPVIVLGHREWPAGILGIAASRLVERFGKPAILVALRDDDLARGSARSLPGFDILRALAAHPELFDTFGGHPLAAGFSLRPERWAELRSLVNASAAEQVGGRSAQPALSIEAYVDFAQLDLPLADQLSRLAPFGSGNPAVVLVSRHLHVVREQTIGRTAEHRRVEVADEQGSQHTALWWHGADQPLPQGDFDLAYTLRASEFEGRRTVQLEWLGAREGTAVGLTPRTGVLVPQVADYRVGADPVQMLEALTRDGDAQIYSEVLKPDRHRALGRTALEASPMLVVWTAPPSQGVWRELVQRAVPGFVYLFALDPRVDSQSAFQRRILSLVKHVIQARAGLVSWEELAQAMAHCVETVRLGLQWLAARGVVAMGDAGEGQVALAHGTTETASSAEGMLEQRLNAMLKETAAYRRYFRQADAFGLVMDAVVRQGDADGAVRVGHRSWRNADQNRHSGSLRAPAEGVQGAHAGE